LLFLGAGALEILGAFRGPLERLSLRAVFAVETDRTSNFGCSLNRRASDGADDMKSVLKVVAAVTGAALLGFAVHDMMILRLGMSSSFSRAPQRLWDSVVGVVSWGIEYKIALTVAFLVSVAVLYIRRVPPLKTK